MNYQKLLLPIALVALSQACTSRPQTSDAAPAPKTTDRASAPETTNATDTPPVISSEPLPIADAQVQSDRARSPKRPESCAPDNYGQFFWQYVKDNDMNNNSMRAPYTADGIQIRDYQAPHRLFGTTNGAKYQAFYIDSVDYTLVYLDKLITDPKAKARLKVDVNRVDEKTFRVDYVKAEFEVDPEAEDNNGKLIRTYGAPGAYIFEHQNGCWNLTQEYRSGRISGANRTAGPRAEFLEGKLTKDMAYADLRKTALTNGWVPLASSDCKTNVGGAALVCDQIPEVNSCSGTGYCLMFFKHVDSGTRLSVTTYGPYDDWQTTGQASRFRVKNWGMGDAATPSL